MFKKQTTALLIATILGTAFIVGCGPSQHDLMMKAARRTRPKPAEEAPKKKPAKKKNSSAPKATAPPPSARAAPAKKEVVKSASVEKKTPTKKALTVDELREQSKLSANGRRKWAADNILAIATALEKYHEKYRYYPPRYTKTKNGLKTLSWRVKLLPQLGYNDLYRKFDFQKPWYMEPNKSLLKFIPKEFVSPERFDTRTNLLLPANRNCFFPTEVATRKQNIEDGPENTIMLVEVNDDMAVEWTAPEDFNAGPEDLKRFIGSLRKDGTFAAWGNGWPVLLSKKVTDQQLAAAFTAAKGDATVSGEIHRPISTGPVSSGSVAAKKAPPKTTSGPKQAAPVQVKEVVKREPLPAAVEIEAAMDRLRRAFADQLQRARTTEQRRSLAMKLLGTANQLKQKPDESYALMLAAERLAMGAGDAETLIKALDVRIGRFEIDAYEENLLALTNFAEESFNVKLVKGREAFIRRSIHVIYAAISENDFLRANKIARSANRYASHGSVTTIPRILTKLQSHLGAAQSSYNDAKEHLTSLRINPDDDEAAAEFGQFLCFIKGDWKTGLPLLARSKNENLGSAAKMDAEGAKSIDEKVTLADAWYALAERASGVYRQAAVNRAVLYYDQAYRQMPQSLDRMHVKNQLNAAKSAEPTGPVALTELAAKAMNVDLKVSLAALATGKRGS